MHDARGLELKIGDRVILIATIKDLHNGEDYCNVTIESDFRRRPDGMTETISSINTGVLLRSNDDDRLDREEFNFLVLNQKTEGDSNG